VLLPILAKAAVGDFGTDVPQSKHGSREFNELLAGIQVLLDTIRQQQQVIEQSNAKLHNIQDQTTEILARVLDSSLRTGRESVRSKTHENRQLD
jgi:hypothetical protein